MEINKIGTKKVGKVDYLLAKIREDLLKEGTGVPVGKSFYSSPKFLPYRWIGGAGNDGDEFQVFSDEDEFQVFFKNKWETAESNDFEF